MGDMADFYLDQALDYELSDWPCDEPDCESPFGYSGRSHSGFKKYPNGGGISKLKDQAARQRQCDREDAVAWAKWEARCKEYHQAVVKQGAAELTSALMDDDLDVSAMKSKKTKVRGMPNDDITVNHMKGAGSTHKRRRKQAIEPETDEFGGML